MLALVVALALPVSAVAGPAVTARSALVMDANTGEVIWEDDGSVPLPPASTTKLMTAIVAIESDRLDESFEVSSFAAATAPSHIGLRAGQRMRLRNLLLRAPSQVGERRRHRDRRGRRRLAGRVRGPHDRARGGARRPPPPTSRTPTASARPATSRARANLAIIMRHALRIPLMREILGTRQVRVPIEGPRAHWVSLSSHNRLLTGGAYRVIGKTGYTRAAGRCFVGAARSGEREIVIALLGSRDPGVTRSGCWRSASGPARSLRRSSSRPPLSGHRLAPLDDSAEGDEEEPVVEPPIGRFVVRLGPYKSQSVAKATRARLARRGYSARVSGRTITLGSFTSQARAQHLVKRLQGQGYRSTVVAVD
jgi:D-alanyl-D-alanine carboxypeptidase (penicillin-binding protein 5/6)